MLILAETLFSWRAEYHLWSLVIFSPIWGGLLYFFYKKKSRMDCYVVLGFLLLVVCAYAINKIWPNEMTITTNQISGFSQFKSYRYDCKDISDVRVVPINRSGPYVSLGLNGSNKSRPTIDYVSGPQEEQFKQAFLTLCKLHNIKLTWDNKVIFQPPSQSNES